MMLADLLTKSDGKRRAIGAPGRPYMLYGQLRELCHGRAADLFRHGIGANDRVAIVLPNGPEMATSFIASAIGATAAPLNPAYKEAEFEFYLSDLNPKAVIVDADLDSPVREVARRLRFPIIDLVVEAGSPAGQFDLYFGDMPKVDSAAAVSASDTALVLHTSGTTSRPKLVPLSQSNLCASATHVARTLSLTEEDHCLNVMPLFHIHGLVAAVLASLKAGACVTCTPVFNAMKFFAWMSAVTPNWYTAVPTIHQAILDRAKRNKGVVDGIELRFIRSSSSSLPPQVMLRLEQTFSCPVIESYGMTEAAHQMTSNSLPPGSRKAGSVGVEAGPEVRLMDSGGRFISQGEGEIVIRGPNVTNGYEANPHANSSAFVIDPDGGGDWFRTGDQGVFDDEGFLSISGRLKEIINRGGEKIAPREVDEVLMDHDDVDQVATFAVPHPKLGEEVAAAVVLRAGAKVTERDLRDFVGSRLAAFKIPRMIVFLDDIPKGATGKLQRIGLAEKLGLGEC